MLPPLSLRAALTRGALVVLANWPVILIEFAIESLYKLTLVVPVVGGALMVAVLAGGSVRAIFEDGVRVAAGLILSALTGAPAAFVSFVIALILVGAGGSLLMFLVKGGTLAAIVTGERQAGPLEQNPMGFQTLTQAASYNINGLVAGIRQFGRRMMGLSAALSVAYLAIGGAYIVALIVAFRMGERPALSSAWPLMAAAATAAGIVALAIVNVIFDLMRVIVVCDDCSLGAAASRLGAFLLVDTRQVVGIFAVVTCLFALTLAASLLVAAGLTLVAWVPVVGLIVVPLQAAAWLIRGLIFQFMSLTALAAYQAQYHRLSDSVPPDIDSGSLEPRQS
jgi:hypothetical protein